MIEPPAECLAQQLERDGREQQYHRPIDLRVSQHAPDMAMKLGEHERREVPDFLFVRARLAQAAAGKPAADRKEQRDELAREQRRQRHHQADDGAGVGAGDQPGEKRAFERQVGGVVVQQQSRGDAGRQRHAQAERKHQPLGPRAAFGDQNVAEAVIPHQDRGQCRDDRDLDDEGRQQELIGGQEHFMYVGDPLRAARRSLPELAHFSDGGGEVELS